MYPSPLSQLRILNIMLEVCVYSKTSYTECICNRLVSQSVRRPDTQSWFSSVHPGEQWNELPPWSTVLLGKLILPQLANSPPQGSLPYSQQLFLILNKTSVFGSFSLSTTTIRSTAKETQKMRHLWYCYAGYVAVNNRINYKCCHGNKTVTRLLCFRHLYCSSLKHTKEAILNDA